MVGWFNTYSYNYFFSPDKMNWDGHEGLLPTTFLFVAYVFLLIHQGDTTCVYKTRRLLKDGCVNYCPEDQCPEECTYCDSGFYGSDCTRSCRGHCLNGRCALLANGRAVNCTEGCVEGWRGLTCSTRCKYPCRECGRYTGDCVGQCRDGFYGPGCLQRCPYTCSRCDKNSGVCLPNTSADADLSPIKHKMTLSLTNGSDINKTHSSHVNKTHSSHKAELHQHSAMTSRPLGDRWSISPYFLTGVAVLSAVITFIIVSIAITRMKATRMQSKTGAVEKREESNRLLNEKVNVIISNVFS
ncbi:multiple epidermal growth factor-like domains protein 10 isoform X1 [Haliotis rufescens]|uniref:multiple epidermal growth factor-like domains protein 10 isoform X1 n=2 Tax=Haliotis rufescens TaxID=6454 RepID=UPI001EB04D11|nr:multiple epidermal growth factor-like domains protein 10 isoform X1 [Haliotis rufescens]